MGCTTGSLDCNVDGGVAAECSRVFARRPSGGSPARIEIERGGKCWGRREREDEDGGGCKGASMKSRDTPGCRHRGRICSRGDGVGALAKRRVRDALHVCPEDVEEEADCDSGGVWGSM